VKLFLRKDGNIEIEGYKCYRKNRDVLHVNSRRGSGCVAVLIKTKLLQYFNVEILNDEVQDFLHENV
jgi:hypothetical protein